MNQYTLNNYTNPILRIQYSDFQREVLEESLPVMVTYTSEYCSICSKFLSNIESITNVYLNRLKFVTIDNVEAKDHYQRFIYQFGINGSPTSAIYYKGEVIQSPHIVNFEQNTGDMKPAVWVGDANYTQYFINFLDSSLNAIIGK